MNVGRRIENAAALIVTTIIQSKGGRADMTDFLPHEDKPEPTLEDAFLAMMGKRRG